MIQIIMASIEEILFFCIVLFLSQTTQVYGYLIAIC